MKYGLSEKQLNELLAIVTSQPEVEQLVLFGSRALGTYKEASDIDLAIKGSKVTDKTISRLKDAFEDSDLPFFVDVVDYQAIDKPKFKAHIDGKGVGLVNKCARGWRECQLGEVAEITSSKRIFYKEYVKAGIPFYRSKEIIEKHDGKEISTELHISHQKYEEIKNEHGVPKKGDLLLTSVGTLGIPYLVDSNEKFYFKDGNLTWFRNYTPDIHNKFLFYWIISPTGKSKIDAISIGSTQAALTIRGLKSINIKLPSLPEQKAIASVLSSLDDKIDLLHRQNKTLEAMAETLFRQWFVEGAREDWVQGTLEEEFNFTMGQSPPGSSFNEAGVGMPMFQGNADFSFRFPKKRVYTTEPKRLAKPMDTLISVRAPVGAQNMAGDECCIGRGVAAFRYKKNTTYYTYTYFKLRSLMNEILKFNDEGTVFGSIGKTDFQGMGIAVPPKKVVEGFEREVKPINDKVISNCRQIGVVETLRDTLLPKLISGEVRVKTESNQPPDQE